MSGRGYFALGALAFLVWRVTRRAPAVPATRGGRNDGARFAGILRLYFPNGGFEIADNQSAAIGTVARTVVQSGRAVVIVGHTDAVGDPERNEDLAYERAAAVARELNAFGVPSALLEWRGEGAREPIADNATELGRAQNRRADIWWAS